MSKRKSTPEYEEIVLDSSEFEEIPVDIPQLKKKKQQKKPGFLDYVGTAVQNAWEGTKKAAGGLYQEWAENLLDEDKDYVDPGYQQKKLAQYNRERRRLGLSPISDWDLSFNPKWQKRLLQDHQSEFNPNLTDPDAVEAANTGKKIVINAINAQKKNKQNVGIKPGSVGEFLIDGVSGFGEMVVPLATTMITKNPLPVLAHSSLSSAGSSYGESRAKGASTEASRLVSLGTGFTDLVVNKIPVNEMLKPSNKMIQSAIKQAGLEGVFNATGGFIKAWLDKGIVSPEMTWGDVLKRAGVEGLTGGLMGGLGKLGVDALDRLGKLSILHQPQRQPALAREVADQFFEGEGVTNRDNVVPDVVPKPLDEPTVEKIESGEIEAPHEDNPDSIIPDSTRARESTTESTKTLATVEDLDNFVQGLPDTTPSYEKKDLKDILQFSSLYKNLYRVTKEKSAHYRQDFLYAKVNGVIYVLTQDPLSPEAMAEHSLRPVYKEDLGGKTEAPQTNGNAPESDLSAPKVDEPAVKPPVEVTGDTPTQQADTKSNSQQSNKPFSKDKIDNFTNDGETKISQTRTNTMEKDLPENVLSELLPKEDFERGVEHWKPAQEEARQDITKDRQAVINGLDSGTTKGSKAVFQAGLLLQEAVKNGDNEGILKYSQVLADLGEEHGRALNAFKIALRDANTPEAAILATQRVLKQTEKEILKKNPNIKQRIDQETEEVIAAVDKLEKDAANTLADQVARDNPDNVIAQGKRANVNKKQASTAVKQTKATTKQPGVSKKKASTEAAVEEEGLYGDNSNEIDNPSLKPEQDPVKSLGDKIAAAVSPGKDAETNLVKEIVSELFNVADEAPLKKFKKAQVPIIEKLSMAISQRDAYKEVWEKTKQLLKERFKDSPEILAALDDYFNKGIRPTFSKKTLNRALSTVLSGFPPEKGTAPKPNKPFNLGEIVRKYYGKGRQQRKDLVETLVNEASLNREDAEILAKHIQNRMKDLIKAKREAILESKFKESSSRQTKDAVTQIEEAVNVGGLVNEKFKAKVLSKRIPDLIKKLLKENEIDLKALIKDGYKAVGETREKFLTSLRERLDLSEKDVNLLVDIAGKLYDKEAEKAKAQLLDRITRNLKFNKRSFHDKLNSIMDLGIYDPEAIRNIIKQKEGIPVLSAEEAQLIVDKMKQATQYDRGSTKRLFYLYDIQKIAHDAAHRAGTGVLRQIGDTAADFTTGNILGNPDSFTWNNIAGNISYLIDRTVRSYFGAGVNYMITHDAAAFRTANAKALGYYEGTKKLLGLTSKLQELMDLEGENLSDLSIHDFIREVTNFKDKALDILSATPGQNIVDDIVMHTRNLSSDILSKKAAESVLGTFLDAFGAVHGIPFNVLTVFDTMQSYLAYYSEARGLIHQQAETSGRLGTDRDLFEAKLYSDFNRYIEGELSPNEISPKDLELFNAIHEGASELSKNAAWKSDLPEGLARLGRNPLWRLLVNKFTKTPINMAKFVVEKTPGVNLLMTRVRDDCFGANGKEAQIQGWANQAAGVLTYSALIALVNTMEITGAHPTYDKSKNLREAGIPEYSIKINGKWYSYRQYEPFATMLGIIASASEAFKYSRDEDKDFFETALITSLGAIDTITSNSMVKGIRNIIDLFDKNTSNPEKFTKFGLDQARTFMPLSGEFEAISKGSLGLGKWPYFAEIKDLADQFNAVYNIKETRPRLSDISGRQIENDGRIFGMRIDETEYRNPALLEIAKHGLHIGPPSDDFKGVELNDQDYWEYRRSLDTKYHLLDDLNALVESERYQNANVGRQKELILHKINSTRRKALRMYVRTEERMDEVREVRKEKRQEKRERPTPLITPETEKELYIK